MQLQVSYMIQLLRLQPKFRGVECNWSNFSSPAVSSGSRLTKSEKSWAVKTLDGGNLTFQLPEYITCQYRVALDQAIFELVKPDAPTEISGAPEAEDDSYLFRSQFWARADMRVCAPDGCTYAHKLALLYGAGSDEVSARFRIDRYATLPSSY